MTGLTVVIPVWDGYCEKLAACVDDVLRQDAAVEVLVVDNASGVPLPPLPSGARTLRLEARVSVGAARNAALPNVATPYVMFVDADDRLLPGTVSFLLEALQRRPDAIAAITKQVLWNPETGERRSTRRSPRPIVYGISPFRRLLALCALRFNIFPIVGCAAVRTSALEASGGFGDGNLGEDWELCAALAWRGKLVFSRRPGRLYAVVDGSLWHRVHDRRAFEEQYERFRERLFSDPAVPTWARLGRPLLTRLHRRDLDRMFRSGVYDPRPETVAPIAE